MKTFNAYKYQHGLACLSDQLLGQQLAHLNELGYLLPKEKVRQAIRSSYNYNYKVDFTHHANCQRTYVMQDEKRLVLCSWPKGGAPAAFRLFRRSMDRHRISGGSESRL